MSSIQLFVKFQNRLSTICVRPNDTINDIKRRFFHPYVKLYHGKLLNNNKTVEHYQLKPNDTIQVLGSLQGGFPVFMTGIANDPGGLATDISQGVLEVVDRKLVFVKNTVDTAWDKFFRITDRVTKIAQFVKGMLTVAKFFPIITLILMVLAMLGRPMEFIIMIFALFLTVIIYIIYSVLNLPPFIYLVMAVWFIIFNIIPFLVYCAVFLAIFIIISLVCILLTIVNTVLWGSLKNFVLCQTNPGDWYKVANKHMGNQYDRALMCNRPCFPWFAPDPTGVMCSRIPKGYPPFCPQAEIMRIYTRRKADRKYKFDDYDDKTNIKYLTMTPYEKEKELKKHYMNKKNFRETCNLHMSKYNPITLNICSSADTMEFTKHLSEKEIARLKQVCADAYCQSDNNYPFCSKMSGLKEDDANAIIKKVIKILILIVVFCLVFLFAMQSMYDKI